MKFSHTHPQFFTATNLEWKQLLKEDKYKDIAIDSLRFMVRERRVAIYSFVIMPNHLHLIWEMLPAFKLKDVQRDFLKFTAQQIKFDLQKHNREWLKEFEVNAKDRQYQFWERNPLSVDLYTYEIFVQKLEFIHNNPVQDRWRLCEYPDGYKYSSARFYETGIDNWGFLTHYQD